MRSPIPGQVCRLARSSFRTDFSSLQYEGKPLVKGATGFLNHGSTCYLNAVLVRCGQCRSSDADAKRDLTLCIAPEFGACVATCPSAVFTFLDLPLQALGLDCIRKHPFTVAHGIRPDVRRLKVGLMHVSPTFWGRLDGNSKTAQELAELWKLYATVLPGVNATK